MLYAVNHQCHYKFVVSVGNVRCNKQVLKSLGTVLCINCSKCSWRFEGDFVGVDMKVGNESKKEKARKPTVGVEFDLKSRNGYYIYDMMDSLAFVHFWNYRRIRQRIL